VVFLERISPSPAANFVNLVLPVAVVYETLLASPNTAAATALQKSTSNPCQFPLSSGAAKPAKPVLIIQFNLPLA